MPLPGVTTKINDRFYSVTRQDSPTGPKIVAIAKRSTASGTGGIADLDVVRATGEADVINAFGNGSDIHRAFLELVIAGADRIFLIPLPSNTIFTPGTGLVESGGTDVFQPAFDAAETVLPDIIVPWGRGGSPLEWESPATPGNDPELGFYADNSLTVSSSWAYRVANATKTISEQSNPCIAVMGVKPYTATPAEKMTPGMVSTHLDLPNLVNRDGSALFTAVGPYLTLVTTEIKPVNYGSSGVDFGYSNGAAFMAATMSRIPSYSSVINKAIYNVEALRYTPTRTQQNNLANKAVNTVVVNFNKVPVFGEGLTFAQTNSDYVRLSTKRIIDEATLVVRQVCQRFVGEPSNMQVRNSLETAITSGLRGMQMMGAILGSDFTVTYIPAQNRAIVDLVLTPAFELKAIEVQIAINI